MFTLKKRDSASGYSLISWEAGKKLLMFIGVYGSLKLIHRFYSAPRYGA